jgi:hypothetical protein
LANEVSIMARVLKPRTTLSGSRISATQVLVGQIALELLAGDAGEVPVEHRAHGGAVGVCERAGGDHFTGHSVTAST